MSEPQPTSMKLNSSLLPREKNTDEGIVSTFVAMPDARQHLRDRLRDLLVVDVAVVRPVDA